ncbi:hypothetical protein SUGI_0090950 [Cryptomeria japonica]|uniref:uncharacterized protein LOC131026765 n=1 Tax=Cryptomeria japonica TaxID=3369 RepID=UPI002408B78E|nr:uncharacterized protein LOC131026765 [Cryptomeria japonica]GLJ08538.1 hypothetical protein SUGI_0090950 [Cryptomeria japonica]
MMGQGDEFRRRSDSEHAGECMETNGNNPSYNSMEHVAEFQCPSPEESVMGESECEVVRENSMVVSNSRSSTAASEIVFETGNFTVVSKSSSHGSNSSSQYHVCRFCSKVFSSGKAMGGHVRIHGAGRSKRHSSSSRNVSRGDFLAEDVWVKKSKVPTSRSNGNSNWVEALSIAGEGEEGDDLKEERNVNVSVEQRELSDQKTVSLYTLRRNPKRSRRLTDEEFSMDLTAKNTVACVECGKEFASSKALFGHMRCHPERDWRGIQLPNDSHYNTTGGDIVLHGAAPSSGFSSVCWQSSQGSEDVEEKGKQEVASDNGSDRESMKSTRVAHHPASYSLFNWSVTAKRGRRRPIRFTQPKEEDTEEEEAAAEVDNTKELEDDRDTAHFLVMLASSASNTNNTNEGNRQVERLMPGELVYRSKKGKRESQGSFKGSEAGQEDLGWKEKVKKRTAKTSRLAELGAGLAGKYECSTCKKFFNTRRALRSHRSSHKKLEGGSATEKVIDEEITAKGNSALMIEYHPAAVNDMDLSPAREEKKSANLSHLTEERSLQLAIQVKKEQGHECCICHKVFSSGQALGGHKRCHRIADRVTERADSVTSSEKKPKLLRDQVREPLFDLNQPAPAEEDDLEAAYAMVEVVPADVVAIDTGFRYVECNMCGSLCTSIDELRAHQSTHA